MYSHVAQGGDVTYRTHNLQNSGRNRENRLLGQPPNAQSPALVLATKMKGHLSKWTVATAGTPSTRVYTAATCEEGACTSHRSSSRTSERQRATAQADQRDTPPCSRWGWVSGWSAPFPAHQTCGRAESCQLRTFPAWEDCSIYHRTPTIFRRQRGSRDDYGLNYILYSEGLWGGEGDAGCDQTTAYK